MLPWSFLLSVSHDPSLPASKMKKKKKKKSRSAPDLFWIANEAILEQEGYLSLAKLNSEDVAGLGTQVDAKSIDPECASE